MHNSTDSQKPLLLVFPYDVMAHYLRCLQIAKYLQPYFSIRFLNSSRYHSFIAEAGFETFECAALNAEKVQQCVGSFDFSWLNENDLDHIYNQQVKVITDLRASAILGDVAPTLKMAAEKTGVYYLSLINGYMSRYYACARRMPGSHPLYKLLNRLPNSLFKYLTKIGEQAFLHHIHHGFSKIRKRAGLRTNYSYAQEIEGDVNLLCDLPELFPQKKLPANYYFIPPLYHPLTNKDDDVVKKLDSSKKTLYISMGSTGNWQKVAFLNDPDYYRYNIVTAGDTDNVLHGPNVLSFPFISSNRLFTVTDLVICHGGNGTIYQALSYGIPVLCKTCHFEQEYNVEGLERLQLGRSVDNIRHNKEYVALIEKWMHKKGSNEFLFIKNKIAEATGRYEQVIQDMLTGNIFLQREPNGKVSRLSRNV